MKLIIETEDMRSEVEDKNSVDVDAFLNAWIGAMVGISFSIDTAYDAILNKADEIRLLRGGENE